MSEKQKKNVTLKFYVPEREIKFVYKNHTQTLLMDLTQFNEIVWNYQGE